jgi:hypothetical protein
LLIANCKLQIEGNESAAILPISVVPSSHDDVGVRIRVTPKGFQIIAQGRPRSGRTLGQSATNRRYPEGVAQLAKAIVQPFQG